MEHHYTLQRYTGPSSKHICPNCGKRSFKLYVDADNNPLDASCGICDHIQSCGYHYPPRNFFHDHPSSIIPHQHTYKRSPIITHPQPMAPFIDRSLLQRSASDTSSFHRWFTNVLHSIPTCYPLGSTRNGSVIFWLIDTNGNIRDGKIIAYDANGHRIHQPEGSRIPDVNWVSAILKKQGAYPKELSSAKCFFGEHILPLRPDDTVCMVESEKTAVIMAAMLPQFIWIATGGCSMLHSLSLTPLANRTLIIFPDAGMLDKWKDFFHKQHIVSNYRFYTQIESYPANTDIADVFLAQQKTSPVSATPSPAISPIRPFEDEVHAFLHEHPQVASLADILGSTDIIISPATDPF